MAKEIEVAILSGSSGVKSLVFAGKWPIELGAPFGYVVYRLEQMDTDIKNVLVIYSHQNPLENDLVIGLSNQGIRFLFDSYCQRLKLIDIHDLDKLKLTFDERCFCSNKEKIKPTYNRLQETFGLSYPLAPGPTSLSAQQHVYIYKQPGILFTLTADECASDQLSPPVYDKTTGLQKLQLPPGNDLSCVKIQIFNGHTLDKIEIPALRAGLLADNLLLKEAVVERDRNGITTELSLTLGRCIGNPPRDVEIKTSLSFGLSCQEVQSRIGSPVRIFYKGEDKMSIHRPSRDHDQERITPRCDYCYNYFNLGMDVIFDGVLHTVKKILLHTNFPGHYDFNMYLRCNFRITLSHDVSTERCLENPYKSHTLNITATTKWNEVEEFESEKRDMTPTINKPIVGKRSDSINNDNRFGKTFFFGYQNMVFEVMQNRHIASILLYKPVNKATQNMS